MNWISWIFAAVSAWLTVHHGRAYLASNPPSAFHFAMAVFSGALIGLNAYAALT